MPSVKRFTFIVSTGHELSRDQNGFSLLSIEEKLWILNCQCPQRTSLFHAFADSDFECAAEFSLKFFKHFSVMVSMLRVLSFPKRLKSFQSDENNIIRKLHLPSRINITFSVNLAVCWLPYYVLFSQCLLLALWKLKSSCFAIVKVQSWKWKRKLLIFFDALTLKTRRVGKIPRCI